MLYEYIALDIETTGLNPKNDSIIEIGAIKVVNGVEVEKFSTFINPERRIPPFITKVTGIDDEMVRSAPNISQVIGELVEFMKGYSIVGHNIMFDYSFIKTNAINNGYDFKCTAIDTLKISREYLKDLESRKLDYLCKYFQIEDENHHRAENDARAAYKLYELLCERYVKEEIQPVSLEYKVKRNMPITQKQAKYLRSLVKFHNIKLDVEIMQLTKSQASRYIDKIILEYGKMWN